ncbi:hypothetical protein SAMN05216421_3162 [Halopseudomonas xinjiangensis]|uniref:Zinc-dependent peptidase n=1 Tax=Halopseudomonas xinjiangensis TaxID=487184 RepID=A0A1H1YI06_9GAMM|nr:M90 family metallopeptidase [Halopseudomonas xinjiangensis]SDT21053.1 hypothetical protein SAMN05216421_3162 [Halopseudomonas xinjiangensis]
MGLFGKLSQWRESRRLEQLEIPDALWLEALGDWAVYRRYAPDTQARLRELALRLVLRKHVIAAGELDISDAMRLRIAGMAAVPVLELGLDWYDGWQTLIIYDGPFIAEHSWQDEYGIVHEELSERSGEAWYRGPVVLSWEDVLASGRNGFNVVVHELSHTLDMRREGANGAPPLHAGMDPAAWKRDMQAACDDLARRSEAGEALPVDEYALEDPAEFFAVLSETFFETPEALKAAWPTIYQHLADFYRQDPLAQIARGSPQ